MPYKKNKGESSSRNPYEKKFHHKRLGYFAALLLSIILLITAGLAVNRIIDRTPPFRFFAMDGDYFAHSLKTNKRLSSLVVIYQSDCEPCRKQMDYFKPLFNKAANGQINFILVAFDNDPVTAADYFKELNPPETVLPYYANPTVQQEIRRILVHAGIEDTGRIPIVALFDNRGRLIVEYPKIVTSKEIEETLKVLKL